MKMIAASTNSVTLLFIVCFQMTLMIQGSNGQTFSEGYSYFDLAPTAVNCSALNFNTSCSSFRSSFGSDACCARVIIRTGSSGELSSSRSICMPLIIPTLYQNSFFSDFWVNTTCIGGSGGTPN